MDTFWQNVEKTDTCWIWKGRRRKDGYGVCPIRTNGDESAHRLSYRLTFGEIPPYRDIHHVCQNKACVRPDHLECLTRSEHKKRHWNGIPRKVYVKKGRQPINRTRNEMIVRARDEGRTYQEIATALGISRQRAHQLDRNQRTYERDQRIFSQTP